MYKYKIVDVGGSRYYEEHKHEYVGVIVVSVVPQICEVPLRGTFHLRNGTKKTRVDEVFFTKIILRYCGTDD